MFQNKTSGTNLHDLARAAVAVAASCSRRAYTSALNRLAEAKGAVELFAYQIGATGKFAGMLPKLMTAVKLQSPADPQAAKPQPIKI